MCCRRMRTQSEWKVQIVGRASCSEPRPPRSRPWALDLGPWTSDLTISGPAPAPLLRAEQFYRYQIMLRTRAMSKLSQMLAKILETLALPEDVMLAVDIDPVDLG